MRINQEEGVALESLTLQGSTDGAQNPNTTVLSCGGIFVPRRRISMELKKWQQIIHLPGPDLSAKIFGSTFNSPDPLKQILLKETLN